MPDSGNPTEALPDESPQANARGFRLVVVEGPQLGTSWESSGDRCSVGALPDNDLVLDDATVSRCHFEVTTGPDGVRIRDLESSNGTTLDGVRIVEATPRSGSLIRVGRSVVRITLGGRVTPHPVSERSAFGTLVGSSVRMRAAFALLERAAQTDSTVLLEGETGTGKEGAARQLHEAGRRRGAPFITIDCGALSEQLIEAELFGHERGAFTGAIERRRGAFETAAGGTIFLDEIGEMPLAVQPTLLRVLEQKEIRPIGAARHHGVDVRVVAATNRDLRAEVNRGTFRADLYFRLAVMRVHLPPLRERPEDIPLLVGRLLDELHADPAVRGPLETPEFVAELARVTWPGNVRELRNFLEQCLIMHEPLAVDGQSVVESPPIQIDVSVPFREARRRVLDDFERGYVQALLRAHDGNVSAAARHAGIGRVSLYELLNRHRLK